VWFKTLSVTHFADVSDVEICKGFLAFGGNRVHELSKLPFNLFFYGRETDRVNNDGVLWPRIVVSGLHLCV